MDRDCSYGPQGFQDVFVASTLQHHWKVNVELFMTQPPCFM